MRKTTSTKLQLKAKTIRVLQDSDLRAVLGGEGNNLLRGRPSENPLLCSASAYGCE